MSLIMIGSGPGIGAAVASLFASKQFSKVALLARNPSSLDDAKKTVLAAASSVHKELDVRTYTVDIADLPKLKQTLQETEADLGPPECVYFNAARVAPTAFFEASVEEIEMDFRVTNLALYETAQWAIPLLKKAQRPALLVTNSMLYQSPASFIFSLCLTKAAQRTLVQTLNMEFGKDVHIGLVSVEGRVSPDREHMSPKVISERAWQLYSQEKGSWELEVEIKEI